MIDLHDRCAGASRLFQDHVDGGRAGVDRQLRTGCQRISVEVAPGRRQLDPRDEGHATRAGNLLQHCEVHGRIVIADEQKIEPRRELRARQIRRWCHRLCLIRVVVQIGGVPAARRRVEQRRDGDPALPYLAGGNREPHLGVRRQEAAAR